MRSGTRQAGSVNRALLPSVRQIVRPPPPLAWLACAALLTAAAPQVRRVDSLPLDCANGEQVEVLPRASTCTKACLCQDDRWACTYASCRVPAPVTGTAVLPPQPCGPGDLGLVYLGAGPEGCTRCVCSRGGDGPTLGDSTEWSCAPRECPAAEAPLTAPLEPPEPPPSAPETPQLPPPACAAQTCPSGTTRWSRPAPLADSVEEGCVRLDGTREGPFKVCNRDGTTVTGRYQGGRTVGRVRHWDAVGNIRQERMADLDRPDMRAPGDFLDENVEGFQLPPECRAKGEPANGHRILTSAADLRRYVPCAGLPRIDWRRDRAVRIDRVFRLKDQFSIDVARQGKTTEVVVRLKERCWGIGGGDRPDERHVLLVLPADGTRLSVKVEAIPLPMGLRACP